jgi:hypothetical protein
MTTLDRSVFRLTRGAYPVLHHTARRQIVAGLEAGDVLTFREKGRRRRFTLSIDGAFRIAVKMTVEAERRAAKAARSNGGGR